MTLAGSRRARNFHGPNKTLTGTVEAVWKKNAGLGRAVDFWYAGFRRIGRVPIGRGYLTIGVGTTPCKVPGFNRETGWDRSTFRQRDRAWARHAGFSRRGRSVRGVVPTPDLGTCLGRLWERGDSFGGSRCATADRGRARQFKLLEVSYRLETFAAGGRISSDARPSATRKWGTDPPRSTRSWGPRRPAPRRSGPRGPDRRGQRLGTTPSVTGVRFASDHGWARRMSKRTCAGRPRGARVGGNLLPLAA